MELRAPTAGPTGSSATIAKFCSTYVGVLVFARAGRRSERSAEFGRVNHALRPHARAREAGRRDAKGGKQGDRQTNRPRSSFFYKESDSNGRLRANNWIVEGFNYDAVKKTVELRLLTVFQHVDDPTRVRTVADKNSAVTPLDLRPTVADHAFKGNSIEVRRQFNGTMNMPSTGRATLPRTQCAGADLAFLKYR